MGVIIRKQLNSECKHRFKIRPHALKQNNALLFGICVYNKKYITHLLAKTWFSGNKLYQTYYHNAKKLLMLIKITEMNLRNTKR